MNSFIVSYPKIEMKKAIVAKNKNDEIDNNTLIVVSIGAPSSANL